MLLFTLFFFRFIFPRKWCQYINISYMHQQITRGGTDHIFIIRRDLSFLFSISTDFFPLYFCVHVVFLYFKPFFLIQRFYQNVFYYTRGTVPGSWMFLKGAFMRDRCWDVKRRSAGVWTVFQKSRASFIILLYMIRFDLWFDFALKVMYPLLMICETDLWNAILINLLLLCTPPEINLVCINLSFMHRDVYFKALFIQQWNSVHVMGLTSWMISV